MTQNVKFNDVVSNIEDIGRSWHADSIVQNARLNQHHSGKSFKQLPTLSDAKSATAVVVSAGPSLHKFNVLQKLKGSGYSGSIVAVDGSMIKCLKNGIVPDYVLTLDPHPTRIIRWFGDSEFEKNTAGDDYFSRQDLDVEFRNNSIKENQRNIELINKHAPDIKLIICSTAPQNVATRTEEAGFDRYWWNPLVDNPSEATSITRELHSINKLPCMNTGGTVGTAAWVFANRILKIPTVALTGMDLGYHDETPIENTQTYYELIDYLSDSDDLQSMFPRFQFPLTNQTFYTDPTYYWYRKNFLLMLAQASGETVNCSEAGTLFNENLKCDYLSNFLKRYANG